MHKLKTTIDRRPFAIQGKEIANRARTANTGKIFITNVCVLPNDKQH